MNLKSILGLLISLCLKRYLENQIRNKLEYEYHFSAIMILWIISGKLSYMKMPEVIN